MSEPKLKPQEAPRMVEMPELPPNREFQVGASVNRSSANASVTIEK